MDQFCRDFDSSFNLASEMSLNSTTLQLCHNKEGPDSYDEEVNGEQGFLNDDTVLPNIPLNTDQGLLNVDNESHSYEGEFSLYAI